MVVVFKSVDYFFKFVLEFKKPNIKYWLLNLMNKLTCTLQKRTIILINKNLIKVLKYNTILYSTTFV